MPDQLKHFKILTTPGLNMMAPFKCRNCQHLGERNICKKWAFPEVKWSLPEGCPDFIVLGPNLHVETSS